MDSGDNLARIRHLGRTLERICQAAAVAVVPLLAFYWVAFNHLPASMKTEAAGLAVTPVLPIWVLALSLLAAMVPGAALMLTLLRLRRLFSLYAKGRIFEAESVASFRSVTGALFVLAAASVISTPLHWLAVTAANPPGKHVLALGISSSELSLLFVAVVAVVISRVMDEARRLEEDHSLTV